MKGRPRRFSDEQLIKALDQGDLFQARAAKILGVSPGTVSVHCKRLCLSFEFGRPAGIRPRSRLFSDEDLAAALSASNGSVTIAARSLGVSRQSVYQRRAT